MGKAYSKQKQNRIECAHCGDFVKPHKMIQHRRTIRCAVISEVRRTRRGLIRQGYLRFTTPMLQRTGVLEAHRSWYAEDAYGSPNSSRRRPTRITELWIPRWAINVMLHTAQARGTDGRDRKLYLSGRTRDRCGEEIDTFNLAPVIRDNDLLSEAMAETILRAGKRFTELRHAINAAAIAGARDLMLDIAMSLEALDGLDSDEAMRIIPDVVRDIGSVR